MIKKIIKVSKIIVFLIDLVTFLFAFKTWIGLPSIIPVQFSLSQEPNRYGSKIILLIFALSPFLALIPWKTKEKEYHCNDDETKKRAEKELKKAEIYNSSFQIVISLLLCTATWIFINAILSNLK